MRSTPLGRWAGATAALCALLLAGCGSTHLLHPAAPVTRTVAAPSTAAAPAPLAGATVTVSSGTATAPTSTPQQLGFPYLATKNTTRVAGQDPVSNAAAVAMAVFPSAAPGTHPTAVALAPDTNWQDALAAASLMGSPFRAPLLLSGPGTLPTATASALSLLAPTGGPSLGGAQVVRIGDVPRPAGEKTAAVGGASPAAIAANLATYEARLRGRESIDVVITSSDDAADAMPAAGWIAESGEPLLYVDAAGVPAATAAQLKLHHHPHIYVLDPASTVPASVLAELAKYGTVKRISGNTPPAESVAFAEYRDPACRYGQPCVHEPGSFGWAIRSPGHGYVLVDDDRPLDAAAAAALSASGGYGPQLLLAGPGRLPSAVLNYLLDYATPGYTSEGPTAAVYNHAWLIGDESEISEAVQAQIDSILEVVPAR